MGAKERALAARFLNEGIPQIGDALRRVPRTQKDIDRLARMSRPVSPREESKWADKFLTDYQVSELCLDLECSEFYEHLLTQSVSPER